MNKNVNNIALYVDSNIERNNNGLVLSDTNPEDINSQNKLATTKSAIIKVIDNTELFCQNQGFIHMYQKDIAG